MSDASDQSHRQPRDVQGLLRLCMETAQPEQSEELGPLDPERREWLSNALQSMTTDVIQEMVKCLEIIKNGLKEKTAAGLPNDTVEQMRISLDTLIDLTGNLDNARDFYKMGGFDVFQPLMESESEILKLKSCELLAEVVQNETQCQTFALENNLLDILVRLLDSDPYESVRIKSLYAISCLIRDNDSAQNLFETKLDGLSILLKTIDSTNPLSKDNKLRIKASFLMSSLCRKQSICDSLYGLGVLTQLIGALQGEHDSTHEHLLAALYALVSVHELSRQDCRRTQWGLKNFLKQRIEDLKSSEEFLEEYNFCKRLLELLFIDKDLPESER